MVVGEAFRRRVGEFALELQALGEQNSAA